MMRIPQDQSFSWEEYENSLSKPMNPLYYEKVNRVAEKVFHILNFSAVSLFFIMPHIFPIAAASIQIVLIVSSVAFAAITFLIRQHRDSITEFPYDPQYNADLAHEIYSFGHVNSDIFLNRLMSSEWHFKLLKQNIEDVFHPENTLKTPVIRILPKLSWFRSIAGSGAASQKDKFSLLEFRLRNFSQQNQDSNLKALKELVNTKIREFTGNRDEVKIELQNLEIWANN
ncbi:MAG: hypothetical protein Tsb0021_07960 [Chlamydiales bacterium]